MVERVGRLLGSDAVVGTTEAGQPIVAPAETAAVALLLRGAAAAGWRVSIAGLGTWGVSDGPVDLVLSTRRLNRPVTASPDDLVATADAGVPWGVLQTSLAENGTWVALDHPGLERSVGSVAATATVGALGAGMGRVRDQVLGVTFVTGEGRIVRAGGTVVKNVAGYDLTKLAIGSFGAFGVLTSVTFRLRAVPRADQTMQVSGPRDTLLDAALAAVDAGIIPSALELFASSERDPNAWSLAARIIGRGAEVQATCDAIQRQAPLAWEALGPDAAPTLWRDRQGAAVARPVTLRLGCVPRGLAKCCDTLARFDPDCIISISVATGMLRATGDFTAERVHRLRQSMAALEVPVTVERAPWAVLSDTGHYGAYREGVGAVTTRLQQTFDPHGILAVPLGNTS